MGCCCCCCCCCAVVAAGSAGGCGLLAADTVTVALAIAAALAAACCCCRRLGEGVLIVILDLSRSNLDIDQREVDLVHQTKKVGELAGLAGDCCPDRWSWSWERRAVGAPKRVDQDWLVKIAVASAGARQDFGGRWGKWRRLPNDATTPKNIKFTNYT